MIRKTAVHVLALWLFAAGGAADAAQDTFSRSVPITAGQFFPQLKEVSLVLKSDPALAQFIPLAEQQSAISKTLTSYGIAVRPNAPVTLLMTVDYPVATIRTKSDQYGESSQNVRGVYVGAQFFVKAAALRNGKFHVVRASIMTSITGYTVADDNELRKALLGDHTAQSIRDHFMKSLADTFKQIPETTTESDAWAVTSWTDKQKAAADADFAKAMVTATPVDRNPYEGLTSAPRIELIPQTDYQECKVDPTWRSSWTKAFERMRWTDPTDQPSLTLTHSYSCNFAFGAAPHYFQLLDQIAITEANLVYELNGRLVRSRGEIGGQHHETIAIENDAGDRTDDRMGSFLSRNITDFLTDLALGNGPGDWGPSGPQSASGAATATPAIKRNARMIPGDEVQSQDGEWHLADGTAVPATLIASKTGLPILMPKQQYSTLRAPVDGHIKEIYDVLREVHSCRVNLFKGSASDFGINIDNHGVVIVLHSESVPGFAPTMLVQGAALANLDLANVRTFNNGECVVVSLQCKDGAQCVRSTTNSSDGADVVWAYFVNTPEQGNKILNALRAIAPFYPDGSGEIH